MKQQSNVKVDLEIRSYCEDDLNTILELFKDTIYCVNKKDYNNKQLRAWVDGMHIENFKRKMACHETRVACIKDQIVGFADMDESGYLDHLYVHKDYQRMGIASALCDALEKQSNVPVFETHASITACCFFEKRGYKVIKKQEVQRNDICLTNFIMKKENFTILKK